MTLIDTYLHREAKKHRSRLGREGWGKAWETEDWDRYLGSGLFIPAPTQFSLLCLPNAGSDLELLEDGPCPLHPHSRFNHAVAGFPEGSNHVQKSAIEIRGGMPASSCLPMRRLPAFEGGQFLGPICMYSSHEKHVRLKSGRSTRALPRAQSAESDALNQKPSGSRWRHPSAFLVVPSHPWTAFSLVSVECLDVHFTKVNF